MDILRFLSSVIVIKMFIFSHQTDFVVTMTVSTSKHDLDQTEVVNTLIKICFTCIRQNQFGIKLYHRDQS